MSKLKPLKPIIFFDLETTGVHVVRDRIVEISLLKVAIDGSTTIYTYRVNPEMPIPETTSLIHGIYDADVANSPTFAALAKELLEIIGDSDLAGYNSNRFDIPMLVESFYRTGFQLDIKGRNCIDVMNIFHKLEPRNLAAAYKFYCSKELVNAHSAEADTVATYEIFLSQLEKYDELPKTANELHTFSKTDKNADLSGYLVYNEKDEVVVNFGKHKGKILKDVLIKEPSYYNWVIDAEFPFHTKKVMMNVRIEMMSNKV